MHQTRDQGLKGSFERHQLRLPRFHPVQRRKTRSCARLLVTDHCGTHLRTTALAWASNLCLSSTHGRASRPFAPHPTYSSGSLFSVLVLHAGTPASTSVTHPARSQLGRRRHHHHHHRNLNACIIISMLLSARPSLSDPRSTPRLPALLAHAHPHPRPIHPRWIPAQPDSVGPADKAASSSFPLILPPHPSLM